MLAGITVGEFVSEGKALFVDRTFWESGGFDNWEGVHEIIVSRIKQSRLWYKYLEKEFHITCLLKIRLTHNL